MNAFLKLNGISAGYACVVLVFGHGLLYGMNVVKPLGLSYSISVKMVVGGTFLLAGLLTWFCMRITKNWMQGRASAFWAAVLWFPYWLLIGAVLALVLPGEDNFYAMYMLAVFLIPFYPLFTATAIGISALWHESAKKRQNRRTAGTNIP
ncbi:hypothetical protein PC41400_23630 [Paenibacillus chitinolyticus]|uniref:Uncharacterized protein n=1 Tax=Paenibacillus chitinolyticus TaxID=79263 RepID=A0A410X1L5_9BACL|nr:hypothetical protein [Paenibacillus chitinolyticus]MCY9592588.1 hypothetical protein [Paenibacillus chitinolyticus]MCY9594809.1 hypothetical protein [Paenibacillus chitinolyticus]QAV20503.1 hypothetical protein PC41400_23630 [Paenibacillus chitinolyticus]